MKRTLLNATIVFVLDDLVVGQGFLTGFIPVFVVIGRLVQAAKHFLMWVVLPPFGRQLYNFETDRWSTLD